MRRCLLVAIVVAVGCGGGGGDRAASALDARTGAAAARSGLDWPRYGFDIQRSNAGPSRTGLAAGDLDGLKRRRVALPGTVDSSPIYLHGVRVGGRRRDVFFVTTTYGRTLAIDAGSGRRLWQFVPRGIGRWEGSYQITNASPVADPRRRAIYAYAPNGRVHKLSVASGHEVRRGRWPVRVTFRPDREKVAPALNLEGPYVLVATGGYIGDEPPYQGHIVAISRRSGRRRHVFNSLCSNRHHLIHPTGCSSQLSAIWARAAPVVVPGSRRLLVTTGNAPFDGRTDWGDSVLLLSRGARRLLRSYTPRDHRSLEATDSDLGSTVPALLPLPGRRGRPVYRHVMQGGKDGKVRLLSLRRLNGRTRRAGPRTGGELQVFRPPRGQLAFTTPAVWRSGRRVFVFSADAGGTVAYEFRGRRPRLRVLWQNGRSGSSPVLAGGLLYVYDVQNGGLNVYRPRSGRRVAKLDSGDGHWNSPIVSDGRIALPEGDANHHSRSGVFDIWSR
ncbi:MAG: PQQ-binding-like beta-propeller repeat protein [Thermoleophilaceae bacterium]